MSRTQESREKARSNIQRGKSVDRLHQRMRFSSLMQTLRSAGSCIRPRAKRASLCSKFLFGRTVYKHRRARRISSSLLLIREGREFIIRRHHATGVYSRCIDNRIRFIALRCPGAGGRSVVDRRGVNRAFTTLAHPLSRFNASFRGRNRIGFPARFLVSLLPPPVSRPVSALSPSSRRFVFLSFAAASHPRSHKRFYDLHPVRVRGPILERG